MLRDECCEVGSAKAPLRLIPAFVRPRRREAVQSTLARPFQLPATPESPLLSEPPANAPVVGVPAVRRRQ